MQMLLFYYLNSKMCTPMLTKKKIDKMLNVKFNI